MPGLNSLDQPPADEVAPTAQVTRLLNAAAAGDPRAPNELFGLIYDHLRAIAQRRMAVERPGHTLQATALVNEVCIRLLDRQSTPWRGRGAFFQAAAQAMRQILIDHARARKADKRGAG